MKKIVIVITVIMCFFATGNAQKKSKEFKAVVKTYQKQTKWFLEEVFALQKTGPEMDTTIRGIMETTIYQSLLNDFVSWGKFVKKNEGEKKFDFNIKSIKGFETECQTYRTEFKKMQNAFVDERFIIDKKELEKILSKEKLQPFIDGVLKKFEDKTKKLIERLRP